MKSSFVKQSVPSAPLSPSLSVQHFVFILASDGGSDWILGFLERLTGLKLHFHFIHDKSDLKLQMLHLMLNL